MRSCAHGHVGRLCLLAWPPPHPRTSLTPSPSSGAAGVATELPRRWQLASLFGAKNCYTTPPTSEGVRVACARTAPFRASTPAARAAQTLLRGLLGSRPATASSRATSTPTAARRLEAAQQQSYKIQYPRKLVQELGHPAAPVCARFRHGCKWVPSLTTFFPLFGPRRRPAGPPPTAGRGWSTHPMGRRPSPGCPWGRRSRAAPGSSAQSMGTWWGEAYTSSHLAPSGGLSEPKRS